MRVHPQRVGASRPPARRPAHTAVRSKVSRDSLMGSGNTAQPCTKNSTSLCGGEHRKTRPDLLGQGWLFSWWGEGEECSQGLRRAAGASASEAWELGDAPRDLRGELQEAGDGPQELEDGPQELMGGPQEVGGGPQEAGGGSLGLGGGPRELEDGPPGPGGELQELVGAPLGPGGEPQQMGEDGPRGLEGGPLVLEGGPLGLGDGPPEQGGGPQMLVGGPLVPVGGPQELGGALQMLGGGPLVLGGGHREPVGAAEEGPEAPRTQAHWAAWGAGAGLLAGAGAMTRAVVAEGANHSSAGVGAASPQEALQGGSAGPVASPS